MNDIETFHRIARKDEQDFTKVVLEGHPGQALATLAKLVKEKSDLQKEKSNVIKYYLTLLECLYLTKNKQILSQLLQDGFLVQALTDIKSDDFLVKLMNVQCNALNGYTVIDKYLTIINHMNEVPSLRNSITYSDLGEVTVFQAFEQLFEKLYSLILTFIDSFQSNIFNKEVYRSKKTDGGPYLNIFFSNFDIKTYCHLRLCVVVGLLLEYQIGDVKL